MEGDARHRPPFPLALFSSGFLVESRQYQSYADRLASWGYVVLTYDKVRAPPPAPFATSVSYGVSTCIATEAERGPVGLMV